MTQKQRNGSPYRACKQQMGETATYIVSDLFEGSVDTILNRAIANHERGLSGRMSA
jgi:hypothetical protein